MSQQKPDEYALKEHGLKVSDLLRHQHAGAVPRLRLIANEVFAKAILAALEEME